MSDSVVNDVRHVGATPVGSLAVTSTTDCQPLMFSPSLAVRPVTSRQGAIMALLRFTFSGKFCFRSNEPCLGRMFPYHHPATAKRFFLLGQKLELSVPSLLPSATFGVTPYWEFPSLGFGAERRYEGAGWLVGWSVTSSPSFIPCPFPFFGKYSFSGMKSQRLC